MADYTVFVDLGDQHGALEGSNRAVDASGAPYAFAGSPEGIIAHYATIAAAIADSANLYDGQYVNIAGGDNQGSGFTNEDAGIWEITSNNGAAYGDYTNVLDIADKASEVEIADANGFFTGTTVEAAIDEIGDKQVAYKLGDTSLYTVSVSGSSTTAFDTALAALVIDNGSLTDGDGSGTSVINGIIVDSSIPYRIPLRDSTSQDPIDDGFNNEVYARLENVSGGYVTEFYSNIAGTETAYSFSPSANVDMGYVFISMDLMKLPPLAGLNDSHFFGDQSGIVGVVDEANITTGPFTDLLLGQATQEAVNIQVDSLGSDSNGDGASLIGLEDSGGYYTSTEVEGALAEVGSFITNLEDGDIATGPFTDMLLGQATQEGVNTVVDSLGSDTSGAGASLIAINDAGSWFDATDVEGALQELSNEVANISAGVTNDEDVLVDGMTDLLSGTTNQQEVNIIVDTLGTATNGEGASLIGIEDAGTYFDATDVEGALQEIGADILAISGAAVNDEDVIVTGMTDLLSGVTDQEDVNIIVDSLGTETNGEGASLIGIEDSGAYFDATDVEGALQEIGADILAISGAGVNDEDVVVDGMTDLLSGTTNQQEVNIIVDSLGTETNGEGASLIGIEDAAGWFDATDVEGALAELSAEVAAISGDTVLDEEVIVDGMTDMLLGATDQQQVNVIVDSLGTSANGEGASLIGIEDVGAYFLGTDVEAALQEIGADLSTLSTDKINSITAFNADGAIGAGTTPQLVSVGAADNDATLTNAVGTSGGNLPAIGFATGAAYSDNDPIDQGDGVVFSGLLEGFAGLTAGELVYADPTTLGGITQTKPTTVGDYLQIVGIAVSATEMIVRIQPAELIEVIEPTAKPIIFRDSSGDAGIGIGENGFVVEPGCLWLDNDITHQNPDKNGLGRYTLFVCTTQWTGTGADLIKINVTANFTTIGKQS